MSLTKAHNRMIAGMEQAALTQQQKLFMYMGSTSDTQIHLVTN